MNKVTREAIKSCLDMADAVIGVGDAPLKYDLMGAIEGYRKLRSEWKFLVTAALDDDEGES